MTEILNALGLLLGIAAIMFLIVLVTAIISRYKRNK